MSLLVDEEVVEPRARRVQTLGEVEKKEKTAPNSETYRYERKFFISDLTRQEILTRIKLHPAMFSEIYHERFVNNIYFDSVTLENYYDSVDGVQRRRKCRIRWYGALFGAIEKPVLELKIKEGFVGRKESFPLAALSLDESFHFDTIAALFRNSGLPVKLKMELSAMQPTLVNRYCRCYFQSADRQYRITVDSDMEYYRIKDHGNAFLHKSIDRENVILELKYGKDNDRYAESIAGCFPFRVTKSSKYTMGIQSLYF